MDNSFVGTVGTRRPVGILGGGQLARMLVLAAQPLGIEVRTFCDAASSPAAQVCANSLYGDAKDPVALRRFLSQVGTVAFENEFVDTESVQQAARGLEIRFAPDLRAIFELQDKIRQKEILSRLGIPSARYRVFTREGARGTPVRPWVDAMWSEFAENVVFKWSQLGYDGYGTCIAASSEEAVEFCEKAIQKGLPIYAEEKIPFRRELSLVACLSTTGEFGAWPLVISEQEKGVCSRVRGPASHLGVSPRLEEEARKHAERLARQLSLYGVFAIEFFETSLGTLCVNEIAPRVHNTGHFTLDAAATSQFENHWRAVLGLPLGAFDCRPRFAMLNLLGPRALSKPRAAASPVATLGLPPGAHLHWYGKDEVRAGRKMGHLNAGAHDDGEFAKRLVAMETYRRDWEAECQNP